MNIVFAWDKIKTYTHDKKSPDIKVVIYDDGFDLYHISLYHNKKILAMEKLIKYYL
jgi:hypothetical protein